MTRDFIALTPSRKRFAKELLLLVADSYLNVVYEEVWKLRNRVVKEKHWSTIM